MNITPATSRFFARPPSKAGTIAGVLTTLFLIVFGLNLLVAAVGEQSPGLTFATAIAAPAALLGAVIAGIRIVRHGERSILEFLSVTVAVLVLLFIAVEVAFGN